MITLNENVRLGSLPNLINDQHMHTQSTKVMPHWFLQAMSLYGENTAEYILQNIFIRVPWKKDSQTDYSKLWLNVNFLVNYTFWKTLSDDISTVITKSLTLSFFFWQQGTKLSGRMLYNAWKRLNVWSHTTQSESRGIKRTKGGHRRSSRKFTLLLYRTTSKTLWHFYQSIETCDFISNASHYLLHAVRSQSTRRQPPVEVECI